MDDQDEIAHQHELLNTYRRTLAHLMIQAARYGGEDAVPTNVAHDIHKTREHIRHLKEVLRAVGVTVSDKPYDELPAQMETAIGSAVAKSMPIGGRRKQPWLY